MKLFRTSDISVVHDCQTLIGFDLPSVTLARRFVEFCGIEDMTVSLLFHCMHVVITRHYLDSFVLFFSGSSIPPTPTTRTCSAA